MTRPAPTLLPMAGHTHGNRSPLTCHLRCGDACCVRRAQHDRDVLLPRRRRAGAEPPRRRRRGATAAGLALAAGALPARRGQAAAADSSRRPRRRRPRAAASPPIAPVATTVDDVTVPRATGGTPIIRWGDPLFAGRAGASTRRTSRREAQAGQFGYNNDYLDIIETNRDGTRALLGVQPRVHQREHHVPARHRPRPR